MSQKLSPFRITRPLGAGLGVFDGVHKGHQKLISRLNSLCRRKGLMSGVITFWPHPQGILGREFPGYIYPLYYRLKLIKSLRVDYCLVLNFNRGFSQLESTFFLDKLASMNIRLLVAGEDFRLGRDQKRLADLKTYLESKNIDSHIEEHLFWRKRRVSSSLIKEYIREANFPLAERLLGRKYFVWGGVKLGKGSGRKLGFPTANLDVQGLVLPPQGVYISQALCEGKYLPSLLSIGTRCTFSSSGRLHVEVYILNFNNNLYRRIIGVRPLKLLRPQMKFRSASSLRKRIVEDEKICREFFRLKKLSH